MTVKRRMVGVIGCGPAVVALALLLAAPEIATAASSPPQVGEADLVVSMVRGRLGESTRELAIKDNVYSEEAIETDADAAARIVFLDGTELAMGPSSRMILDRYVYDPNTGAGEMAMRMVTGVFQFVSGNIPDDGYDLGTPFGNLAIRGTAFVINIVPGARAVLETEDGAVGLRGATVTPASGCFVASVGGGGGFPGEAACAEELEPALAMLAMLGLPQPAAGPISPAAADVRQGPGAENDPDPPGFGALGSSPQ
jgi:FecR protein